MRALVVCFQLNTNFIISKSLIILLTNHYWGIPGIWKSKSKQTNCWGKTTKEIYYDDIYHELHTSRLHGLTFTFIWIDFAVGDDSLKSQKGNIIEVSTVVWSFFTVLTQTRRLVIKCVDERTSTSSTVI